MNNKKGVSGVITSVLMILLVIAAIGILWFFVQGFLKSGLDSTQSASECLQLDLSAVDAKIVTSSVNNLEIRVKKNSGDFDLDSLKFLLISKDDGTSTELTVTPNPITDNLPGVAETKKFIDENTNAIVGDSVEVVGYLNGKACGTPAQTVVS